MRRADDACSRAKEQAKAEYDTRTREALEARNAGIGEAWDERRRTVDQAWSMFIRATGA